MVEKILYSQSFLKHFRARVNKDIKLSAKYEKRVKLFLSSPQHALLRNHNLIGKHSGDRAFSVTGDIRVIYKFIDENTVLFLDIGTHNQVY